MEMGTHHELMAARGVYANLWNAQLQSSAVDDVNDNSGVEVVRGAGDEPPGKKPRGAEEDPQPGESVSTLPSNNGGQTQTQA